MAMNIRNNALSSIVCVQDLPLDVVVVLVVLTSVPAGAGRGVGSRRGERQQGAEEHQDGGPEHEQTKCQ